MNNSLKIGALSGLIAGIIAGIIYTVFMKIVVLIGLYDLHFPIFTIAQSAYGANILSSVIFGVICGLIYTRVYVIIPGKGISKAIVYSMILLLISWIRMATFVVPYGFPLNAVSYIFTSFFQWIAYGLILGFLYEFLYSRYYPAKEETEIITHNLKSGILPGAIAGFLGGFGTAIAMFIATVTGLFAQTLPGAPEQFSFSFWISQSGAHLFINLIWGAIFGMIFTKVYNVVPGKGVLRALCYSMILFLLSSFLNSMYWIGWGLVPLAEWTLFVGFFHTIIFGIVLGLLYRKPSD